MSNFKEYRINKVIAIDDVFDNIITEDTKISNIPESIIGKVSNIHFEDTQDEDTTLESFYRQSDQTLKDYFEFAELEKDTIDEYIGIMGNNDEEHYQTLLEGQSFKFLKWGVTPQQELKEKISTLKNEKEKTLIILDKNLTVSREDPEIILSSVLKEINKQLINNKNLFLVLFSTHPEDLKDYTSVFKYLNERLKLEADIANNLALHINFVNKYDYEINHFISSLRKSQKANYVNSFDDIYSKCIISLKQRIWDMNNNEALLNYDYLMEGQQVDNIIYDMFTNKFNYTYNKFRKDNYDKIINPIRNSMQKYENFRVAPEEHLKDHITDRFRILKEINYYVNSQGNELEVSKSDDISYGDIIEIDKSKYVVISQNCDTTIRNSGDRKLDSFNLIKIEETVEKIDANWLVQYYRDFLNVITKDEPAKMRDEIKENKRKIFYDLFFNEDDESEIQKMGFESSFLKEIEDANKASNPGKALKKLKFTEPKELANIKTYKLKKNQIYTIPCFWLDVLLLRKEEIDVVRITKKDVNNSKEIRLATKKSIEKQFDEMIVKCNGISKEVLKASLKTSLFNPIIPIEIIWDPESNSLAGFQLNKVKRERCLTQHEARRLHKEVLDAQTREAINLEIPI